MGNCVANASKKLELALGIGDDDFSGDEEGFDVEAGTRIAQPEPTVSYMPGGEFMRRRLPDEPAPE